MLSRNDCVSRLWVIFSSISFCFLTMHGCSTDIGGLQRKVQSGQVSKSTELDSRGQARAFYEKGNVYYEAGDYNNAIINYSEAKKIEQNFAPLYFNLGMAQMALGKNEEASASFSKYLKLRPYASNAVEVRDYIKALQPSVKKARIYVTTDPHDATVRIVAKATPYTPGIELSPGFYVLEVSKPGYQTERYWVKLEASESERLKIVLMPSASRSQDSGLADLDKQNMRKIDEETSSENHIGLARRLYYTEIWTKIRSHWGLRNPSQYKGMEAILVLVVSRDGKVHAIRFQKRSGNDLFDEAAMEAVRKAEPLPPFPAIYKPPLEEIGVRFRPEDS